MHFYFFRYLKEKNYPASIVRHDVFPSSRQVLEDKAKIARMDGKGTFLGKVDNSVILLDSLYKQLGEIIVFNLL